MKINEHACLRVYLTGDELLRLMQGKNVVGDEIEIIVDDRAYMYAVSKLDSVME